MRLPFVSRNVFEFVAGAAAREIAELRADLRDQRDANRALVQQIVELRREGFHAPKPPREAPAIPNAPVDLDEVGREGAKREAIARMTADFIRNGTDPEAAEREAARLINGMSSFHEES